MIERKAIKNRILIRRDIVGYNFKCILKGKSKATKTTT